MWCRVDEDGGDAPVCPRLDAAYSSTSVTLAAKAKRRISRSKCAVHQPFAA